MVKIFTVAWRHRWMDDTKTQRKNSIQTLSKICKHVLIAKVSTKEVEM